MAIKDNGHTNFIKLKSDFRKKRLIPAFYPFIFLILLSIPLLMSGCAKKPSFIQKVSQRIKVNAAKTSYKIIGKYLKSSGNVVSLNNTVISAHIMGYVVYDNIHLGQSVKKGQLLLRLSAPEVRSKYYAAEAAFVNAQKTYNRINMLYKENSVSRQMHDNAFMRYKVAKANLNAALSYLNYKNIYSPINGVITQKKVFSGDLAAPGQMLLMVQAVNRLEFKTNVSVKYYKNMASGKRVKLDINSTDKTITGNIISVVKSANPYSHSVVVRIKINNPKRYDIFPGMYGVARFKIGRRRAIIIPEVAVLKKLGIWGVYIANNEGEVMFQPIKKGPIYKKNYIIALNGLSPGLTVITSGLSKISAGGYVSPVYSKIADRKF